TSSATSSPCGRTNRRTRSSSSAWRSSWSAATRSAVRANRLAIDDDAARAGGVARDAADELVRDRAGDARMRLREQTASEEHDGGADRQLCVELDRERVHRDRADDAAKLAGDPDLRSGEVAPEAVGVAHGDDADPGVALGDEAPAVPGALARRELADLRELRRPREDGLERVVRRVGAEGREAVQRDAAPRVVEARGRVPQCSRAVRDVARELRVRRGRCAEAL